jgi:hypothetical protein
MPIRDRATWTFAVALSIALLLAPAIWNGFALLQYDTGGYLARWFEGYLVPSRSTVYGLYLVILAQPNFWPAIVIQAGLTVWLMALLLRAHGLGGQPILLVGITALLSIATTLPWLAGILLTDIFAGLAVLALYLLLFSDHALRRWERCALFALLAFAVATHSATFAVVMALVVIAAVARCLFRLPAIGAIVRGTAALALGAALLVGANYTTARRLAWTPGGIALTFGRMLQDGIVARYLAEHCPDPRLKLCAHRHELPSDADVFFWGESVFDRLGRFRGLEDEMRLIVLESLRAYPLLQAKMAALAAAHQLVRVGTGEGIVNTIWHTYAIIEQHVPSAIAGMRAARQQKGEFTFTAINRLHKPVALGSMFLLLAIIVFGLRREPFADLSRLAATAALALLANAVVCGVFANPHDRYGARLAWIAPFIILIAICRLRAQASAPSATAAIAAQPAGLDPPAKATNPLSTPRPMA